MQKLVQQRMKMLEDLPTIIGPVSVKLSDVHTGAWRYRRPVINADKCILCGICADLGRLAADLKRLQEEAPAALFRVG